MAEAFGPFLAADMFGSCFGGLFSPTAQFIAYGNGPDGEFGTADDECSVSPPPENAPPRKCLAAYAATDEGVYMLGGLYHHGGATYSTPCLWYYYLASNGWFYLPDPAPPYADTGVWDAHAWWDPDEDSLYLVGGWFGWPGDLEWEVLFAGDPEDWDWDNWEPNDKVFVLRHPRQLAGPGGPGGQPPGRPPGPGGGQGRPRKDEPDEPEEQPPYLERCVVTDAVQDGEPVSLNPVFTGADTTAIFWFKLSPLCDPHSYRVEIYDADGYLHDSLSDSTPNPDEHGVDCFGSYSSSWEFPLGPAEARPHGTWWAELYLDDVLVCTTLFEVKE